MIEEILDTNAKIKIMKVFCQFPERKFQMIEVAKYSNLSNSRTSECLRDLARVGLLESRKIGKGCEYKLNLSNYYSKMLLRFFKEEEKLLNNIIKDYIKDIKTLEGVESIVLFGSALTGLKIGSDIDFLIIGKEMIEKEMISVIETELINKYGFHISTAFMTEEELKEKAKKGEEFVINVIASGKLIYGKILEDIVWSEK
jgi:predicted nucleotidyltransferase